MIPRNLNAGCGEFYAEGVWLNVDLDADEHRRPDVLADVRDLPFSDGQFDRVYAGHVLEHLPLTEVVYALEELHRVLRVWGELMVVGPDLDRAREGWPHEVQGILTGGRRWPGDEHLWPSTASETSRLCREVFPFVQEVEVEEVPAFWPVVSRVGYQFALLCHGRTG